MIGPPAHASRCGATSCPLSRRSTSSRSPIPMDAVRAGVAAGRRLPRRQARRRASPPPTRSWSRRSATQRARHRAVQEERGRLRASARRWVAAARPNIRSPGSCEISTWPAPGRTPSSCRTRIWSTPSRSASHSCRACSTPTAGRSPRPAGAAASTTRRARPRLHDDVLFLVRSLGGVAYSRVRPAKGRRPGRARGRDVHHRPDVYCLDIRLPEGIAPFRLARKAALYERYRRRPADAPHRRHRAHRRDGDGLHPGRRRRLALRHRRLPGHPQHAQLQLHHLRRGPEHHARADEDVPHPHRVRLAGGRHRRRHPGRRAEAVGRACSVSRTSSAGIDGPRVGPPHEPRRRAPPHRAGHRRRLRAGRPSRRPTRRPRRRRRRLRPTTDSRARRRARRSRSRVAGAGCPTRATSRCSSATSRPTSPVDAHALAAAGRAGAAPRGHRRRRRAVAAVRRRGHHRPSSTSGSWAPSGPTDVLAFPLEDDLVEPGRFPDSGTTGPGRPPGAHRRRPSRRCCSATW